MEPIRTLKANEIECKVSTISEKGCSILLYKTARCDMQLLDETFGAENWDSEYKEIKGNLYCGITVYFNDKPRTKWDCGVESQFGDKEKGEASDAFKRAGFKWGIGRELYTAPFVWINSQNVELKFTEQNGKKKYYTYDRFKVSEIEYDENRSISKLSVVNEKTNRVVYTFGEKNQGKQPEHPEPDKKITSGTIKQIEILAKAYSELLDNVSPLDVISAIQNTFNFKDINSLTDEQGQIIIKKENDWINKQKKKLKDEKAS